jgi:hypothetical protein
MKECIACAEEIKENAKLCKHCGTTQDDSRFSSESQPHSGDMSHSALVAKAVSLFVEGRFDEGLKVIEPAVEAKDPEALASYGWAHHDMGDNKTALKFNIEAAELGSQGAMWNVVSLLDVDGCSKADRKLFRKWLSTLSDLGNTDAMLYLYQDHLDQGEEGPALDWLHKAKDAGSEAAAQELETAWDYVPVKGVLSESGEIVYVENDDSHLDRR